MKRRLLTCGAVLLLLLLFILNISFSEDKLLAADQPTRQQDPRHEPKGIPCSAGTMPDIQQDIDAWAEWFEGCGAESTGGGGGGGGVQCTGNPRTFTGPDGKCWRIFCEDGGWKIIPCRPLPKPTGPQLDSVMVRSNGYTVHIVTAHGGRKEKVSRHDVKLVHLVRAMVNGSTLPAGEVRKVPKDFWTSQKSLTLK